MGGRPRIGKKLIGDVIIDEVTYIENKSSKRARKILNRSEHIEIEIWCGQHYYKRALIGDENGKREGIEEEGIKELVVKSIPHLLYYLFKIPGFAFINFGVRTRYIRLLIQEVKKDVTLNIVTEFHYVTHNKYEATVITAMQSDDFAISLGQNILEMNGDVSYLRQKNSNHIVDIDNYSK